MNIYPIGMLLTSQAAMVNQAKMTALSHNLANLEDHSVTQMDVDFSATMHRLASNPFTPSIEIGSYTHSVSQDLRMSSDELFGSMARTAMMQQALFKVYSGYTGFYNVLFNK